MVPGRLPGRSGHGWKLAQVVPFQCRISGTWPPPKGLVCPTAHASVADTALAPDRLLPPPGFGVGTRRQDVPSQCTLTVRRRPLLSDADVLSTPYVPTCCVSPSAR